MKFRKSISKSIPLKESVTLFLGLLGGYVVRLASENGGYLALVLIPTVIITVCLLLLAVKTVDVVDSIEALSTDVKAIDEKVAIGIRFLDRESAESEIAIYQEFKKIIDSATKTILVVNSYLVEHSSSFDAGSQEARNEYYNALIRKAEAGLEYKRIIQVKPDGSTIEELPSNKDHAKHFPKMFALMDKLRDTKQRKVALKLAPARRLSTFVLIDKKLLIWQINEILIVNGKEDIRLQGAFIINDPQEKITKHFQDYYDYLDIHSHPITLRELKMFT